MWTPEHFRAATPEWDAELVGQCPFGLLVTSNDSTPEATHVPMLIHPDDRERAATGLTGCRILGHLARLNSHWTRIEESQPALLVFPGVHGYVSPTVYGEHPAAPTWNYAAVHVTGPITLVHDPKETMTVIDRTIDVLEGSGPAAHWDREPSRDYFDQIIRGVVAFEVRADKVESSYKLSQDQPPDRRAAAVEASARQGRDPGSLGHWMSVAAHAQKEPRSE